MYACYLISSFFFQEKPAKLKSILVKHKNKANDTEDLQLQPILKRSRHTDSDLNHTNDNDLNFTITPRRNDAANQLLNRPMLSTRPVSK